MNKYLWGVEGHACVPYQHDGPYRSDQLKYLQPLIPGYSGRWPGFLRAVGVLWEEKTEEEFQTW